MDCAKDDMKFKSCNISIANNLSFHDSWVHIGKTKHHSKGVVDIC